MADSAPNPIAGLFQLLENQAIVTLIPILVSSLPGLQQAGTDPVKLALWWIKFRGDILGAAPALVAGEEGVLFAGLDAKLEALLTRAQQPAPQPGAA